MLNKDRIAFKPLLTKVTMISGLLLMSTPIFETASAEPWFGSRFARNCAGCHAPQRFNRPPKDRRCALSCQGCHVNPNGGGLRNFYGKWNEERWLRSFKIKQLDNKKSFAVFKRQKYGKKPHLKGVSKKRIRKVAKDGFPLVETKIDIMDENKYWQGKKEYYEVPTLEEFKYRIPKDDPYRQRRQQAFIAGIDARQIFQSSTTKKSGPSVTEEDKEKKNWINFLMNVDVGVSFHPVKEHVSLVYEGRALGSPAGDGANKENTLSKMNTRSLYGMVDDLPFNVFAMYGYYRPLFGNYSPDHTALSQKMFSFAASNGRQSNSQKLTFKALSIGTAPNVPYANLHLIDNIMALKDDKTKGFALNLGLRGVTYGQSVNYSYWRTTNENQGFKTFTEMHALGMFVMLGKAVLSYEGIALARDDTGEDFRRGGVHTLETFYRVWRENYVTFSFASANVTPALLPGSATQLKLGVRSFLVPGVDVSLTIDQDEEKIKDGETKKTDAFTGQLHVFL